MHDPKTVAFEIKYPWRAYSRKKLGNKPKSPLTEFESTYHASLITIWHVDPELDGSADSCGWFIRARHGKKSVLERIVKRFESDWDRTWTYDETNHTYMRGLFRPTSDHAMSAQPVLSTLSITLYLIFLSAMEVCGSHDKARAFVHRHLADILLFAENPTDSLYDLINDTFDGAQNRAARIHHFAEIIYPWVLRQERPWWRHPRWHFKHWSIQVHPWQTFRRWALSRCSKCGKGFRWGESPYTDHWTSPPLRFMRGEVGVYHSDCSRRTGAVAEEAKADIHG